MIDYLKKRMLVVIFYLKMNQKIIKILILFKKLYCNQYFQLYLIKNLIKEYIQKIFF